MNSNEPAKPKPGQIIRSIHDLMLDKFITAVVEKDLSVLVKDWTYVQESDINEAWNTLMDEYQDAIRYKDDLIIENVKKEIVLIDAKILAIHSCVNRLCYLHSDEIITELKKWWYISEKLDPADPEQYEKDLKQILGRTNQLESRKRDLLKELEERQPETVKVDKAYFSELIVQVKKHMKGSDVNKFTTSVGEFTAMIKDMRRTSDEFANYESNKNQ